MPQKVTNLEGQPFGRLMVLRRAAVRPGAEAYWVCQCACGTICEVKSSRLRTSHAVSCGCAKQDHDKWDGATADDHPDHDIYTTWNRITQKCHGNTSSPNHQITYQDRGIVVCSGWRDSFFSFRDDIGRKPTPQHQIDRIDTNGNYSCGHCPECLQNGWTANCRWLTCSKNQRNRRSNRMITFRGKTMCLADWGDEVNIPYEVIGTRLGYGWSIERALTEPCRPRVRSVATRGIVYIAVSITTGMKYIGQTTLTLKDRRLRHERASQNKQTRDASVFLRALHKYGRENFTWNKLSDHPREDLAAAEAAAIIEHNTQVPHGYNVVISTGKRKRPRWSSKPAGTIVC